MRNPGFGYRRAVAIMVLLFAVPVGAFAEYGRANGWVLHTLDVAMTLTDLRASVIEAESAQRGFVLYRQDAYREAHTVAVLRVHGLLARLEDLTADNPVQTANARRLDEAVVAKIDFMTARVGEAVRGEPPPAGDSAFQSMAAIEDAAGTLKAEENRLLEQRTSWKQVLLRATAAAAAAFLVATGWLLAVTEREVRRRYEAEREEKTRLAQALADRDLLLREVNHRVKNSLQMVSAIITMQSARAPAEVRAGLDRAAARIRSIAAIHQRLYQSDRFRTLALGPYLRDLCAEVVETMGEDKSGVVEIPEDDPVEVPLEIGVPTGLLVNELVSNAFKHGGRRILVRLERCGEGIVITVRDDGPGLPDGFATRDHASLGWKLIQGFSRQIGARLEILPDRPGAAFRVIVPVAADEARSVEPPEARRMSA
jgi:two-component sensor histidine kinase/CHASE3 domain sensor protein